VGGKGSGRKPAPKAPPGLATTPEELKARVGGGGKAKAVKPERVELAEPIVDFPVESLTLIHSELWKGIAKMARSSYIVSEDAAREMGALSAIVLKQYLGPALADHAPLGAYLFSQLSAIVMVMTTRQAKPAPKLEEKPVPAKEEPKPQYREPAVVPHRTAPVPA
jgi:hypothetical protein